MIIFIANSEFVLTMGRMGFGEIIRIRRLTCEVGQTYNMGGRSHSFNNLV